MVQAVRVGGSSAPVIRDIFQVHFPPLGGKRTVLDLTYGLGVWWKWDWGPLLDLTRNDLYVQGLETCFDFTQQPPYRERSFDVVCFDPPFAAMGPSKKMPDLARRYGSVRSKTGPGPRNALDVRWKILLGVKWATWLAREGVIIKVQDVVESGENWDNVHLAEHKIGEVGWQVEDKAYLVSKGRPQPAGRAVRHLRGRPSVFVVAKP